MRLKAGKLMVPVETWNEGKRLFLKFGYNPKLIEEIKSMEGAKYHGYDEDNPRKLWSILDNQRNRFQLKFLEHPWKDDTENPYHKYNIPLQNFESKRPLYGHQQEGFNHILTRHYCILAYDMGLGKSLICIEAIERAKVNDVIWVAPKSAMYSVMLEYRKWKCNFNVRFMTYEQLKKLIENWTPGVLPPDFLIFDEASRVKNHSAQRSQAAQHIADAVRIEWGDDGFVVLLSGSPAPKSPADWHSLTEIAQPGFLKEGTVEKLKYRLAVIEQRETFAGGGSFAQLKSWRDDSLKCNKCGEYQDSDIHKSEVDVFSEVVLTHNYEPSINEVELLYKRMDGLVLVKKKESCVKLPDKIYREINIKPTQSMLNAAKVIEVKSTSAIQALTLLRELSDGFQYQQTITGSIICPICYGERTTRQYSEADKEKMSTGIVNIETIPFDIVPCDVCNATGQIDSFSRESKEVPSPKEDILREIIQDHNDCGRIVIYGGFTATIDRLCRIVQQMDWKLVRVDGRGWFSTLDKDPLKLQELFQDSKKSIEKIAWVAHPGSGGMGVTLHASPTALYYSNDFNGENRMQSEDRIHRIGMDDNRCANIIDLLCLSSDKIVLDNLKEKKRLQDMSMGLLIDRMKSVELSEERNI